MKITCAIPYYENSQFIEETLQWIIKDERVTEIIICDDDSNHRDFEKLIEILKKFKNPKIKLYKNKKNLGVYLNKIKVISLSTNNWIILLDSDNIILKGYIDKLELEYPWDKKTIYAPVWAKTFPGYVSQKLNWTKYENKIINSNNIPNYETDNLFIVF